MSIHQEPVFEPSILARSLWSFLSPWNFGSSFCGSKVQKSERTWTKTMHYIVFLFLLQPNTVYAAQAAQESCMIVRFSCHHLSYPRFSASL